MAGTHRSKESYVFACGCVQVQPEDRDVLGLTGKDAAYHLEPVPVWFANVFGLNKRP